MFHPDVFAHMLTGALECLLRSELDDDGEPLDDTHGVDDIANPEEIENAIIGLVFSIPNDTLAMLEHYYGTPRGQLWTRGSLFGHDFILSSNGHGAGFWDRGAGELGRRIHDMCVSGYDAYVGDDGQVWVS